MGYIRHKVSMRVLEEVESITSTLPGKAYYSDDGEALILADEGTYIISVEPPDPSFNNGDPTTHSAYLFAEPAEHECPNQPGWATGWEC